MINRLTSRFPLGVDLIFLLVVGGVALFSFLGQNRNWSSREIRHAEIMREMAETDDLLIPRLMGEVYYDKPPVMHFVGAKLMQASREPNLFQARFPSALAALFSVFAVYGLGRMLGGREVGLVGALVLLAMPGFWIAAQVVRPDSTLVALILISCLFLGWAMRSLGGRGMAAWLISSGVAAALAVITKGPYGLLVPILFLGFAPRENRDMVRPGWRLVWFFLGMGAIIVSWAWQVYGVDGGEYLRGVVFQEDLSTGGGSGHFEPFYWYIGSGFLHTLPVILFLPLAVIEWKRGRRFPSCLVIAAVILFILSCVPGKRRHYLLPLLPFLALGLAEAITSYARRHRVMRHIACAIIIGGIAAGPLYHGPILRWLRPQGDPEWDFITDVAEAVPADAVVVCFGSMNEYLAWVRRDYHEIVGVQTLEEAELALRAGKDDRYLVASEEDLLILERDPDMVALRTVLARDIDRKGRWLLALFDK